MSDHEANAAGAYLNQAVAVAQKLKPGTYEHVQALALISIAINLQEIADGLAARSSD